MRRLAEGGILDTVPSSTQDAIILLFAFVLSSCFAVIKIVLFSLNRNSLAPDQERLRYYASKIEALHENRPRFDGIVSFGRVLSITLFGLYTHRLMSGFYPEMGPTSTRFLSLGASSIVLGLFAYSIPRAFARRYYESWVPLVYILYSVASWLLMPLVATMLAVHDGLLKLMKYDGKLAFLSSEDKSRMNDGENGEEGLDEEEREMIRSIFELGETTVGEIMVPRIDIKALEMGTDLQTVLRLVREDGHSRLPVFRETIDSIAGILYVKDIIGWLSEHGSDSWDIAALIKTPHFVPTGKKIDDLMADFKRKHIHIAVVVDEYGGTAGVVTMEDILEEIVGEIQDEYDEEELPFVKVSDNTYHVDPHIDLHDLGEEIGMNFDLEEIDFNTLGGLIYHEHGDVPEAGTTIEYEGLQLRVLGMDGQRIKKVELTVPRERSVGVSF